MTVLPVYDRVAGSGPTLVFLHYWGGSSRTWAPVVDLLGGHDMVTVDARGWGRSRHLPGAYTLNNLTADVHRVIADAGVTDYVLVGHSMGGKVAQLVAAGQPAGLRGMVLVGSAPAEPPASVTADYQQQLAHAYDSPETVAAARDHILTATPLPDELKRQIVADSLNSTDQARLEWPLHGIAEDISAATRTITVPALVIAGEHDLVEPVAVLREHLLPHLANAEFAVIPGSGHLLPLEVPGPLAHAIEKFVGTVNS